ncbi:uracil-DNA glycosylase [Dethiosulfatarculus sandiegensis]|uniref:Uracil-DNA glycosylase n=1 Tax=Dethiosulfatarculus sandiegensis TaxID=1429043 RepID=A0A0D2J7H8_9BACT|nr:uracil-DNA glycosylase [Dethiosulfatarculus sandiegensis]KIX14164.1 uracil-DNA glycosylase [Dethiosulfatarculus sandiegensis]
MQTKRPNCFKCRHFALTWQKQRPYICKAMGFQSRTIPWQVVVRTSGKPCLLYSPKPEKPPKRPGKWV